jgi:uncharacterized protein with transglutaminase domain
MKNLQLYIVAAVLLSVSVSFFLYKAFILGLPLHPDQRVEHWEIQARITFEAKGGPVKVSVFAPRNEGFFTIIDQSFASEGYGVTTGSKDGNPVSIFSVSKAAGPQAVYYRFVVNRSKSAIHGDPIVEAATAESHFKGAKLAAAKGLLKAIVRESSDDDTLVRLLLKRLTVEMHDENAHALLGIASTTRSRLLVARQILALAGVSSRLVTGVQLVKSQRNARLAHWLEVFTKGKWQAFAPQTGTNELPANFFPWWRGDKKGLVSLRGGGNIKRNLSVVATSAPALRAALDASDGNEKSLITFSLFSLPVDTQQVYKIILTVPFGVFFLTIMRNVIGLRTFGTFMPVLIAIAFRETQLVWGLFLLSLVITVAFLVRSYLGTLRMLVVPRLSSILIIVILAMASVSVLSNQIGLERGLSPMVILTMTVERMSIILDERGPGEMLRQCLDSILVAIVVYFIMVNPYAEHMAIVYPEVLIALLAFNLLLGRYSGFRLLDLVRFRVLEGKKR